MISEPNNIPSGPSPSRTWAPTERHETYVSILKNHPKKLTQKGTKTSSSVYIPPHRKKQYVLNKPSEGKYYNLRNSTEIENTDTIIISNIYSEAKWQECAEKDIHAY